MINRWQMNRAGVVNFWYYDEAEFYLDGGKLILRGANGSGKSVTMQSFLPLVLDGDKRPWRLDPFGSRDRQISYYLLLEADSGHTDRTGYLYMEFYHPVQDRYLTVGIGLRARRNNTNLGFWGFVINDNRRVGHDIQLYESDYSQGKEAKIPLSRARLEEVIGSGGQVVTEQGDYMRLVNRVLFGYERIESFQELLDLLIQLRSPKLSKDFKPSTIYEILTEALPTLQEDELRPLSEVLEDMDEINDRLNELSVHRQEVDRLAQSYNKYNEFLLYSESQELLQQKKQRDDRSRDADNYREMSELLAAEVSEKSEDLQKATIDLEKTETEYKVLAASEAVEKRAELNHLRDEEKELYRGKEKTSERLASWQDKKDRAIAEQSELTLRLEEGARQQADILTELEETARDIDFGYHDVYHRFWTGEVPSEGDFWAHWGKDIKDYRAKINQARKLAAEESNWKSRRVEAEKDASLAREKRELEEESFRREEANCEDSRRCLEEAIFTWCKELNRLPLEEAGLQRVMQALALYPEETYENVRIPVKSAYDLAGKSIMEDRLTWQGRMDRHQEEKDRLSEELKQWQEYREPEPPRSNARENSRRLRGLGVGAPLYAICEFQDGLGEEKKAMLESTLQQSGLLDAWVAPEGLGVLGPEEEEVWLKPAPQYSRVTLADYLVPAPPKDSGVAEELIDQVLRTVCLEDQEIGEPGDTIITDQGYFRLGALMGKAPVKEMAEFIGKETRLRTRLAEIARLEGLLAEEEKYIVSCLEQLKLLEAAVAELDQEMQSFPDGSELQEAYRGLDKARLKMESALEDEQRKHSTLREIIKELNEAVARLHDFMTGWNIPRTERALEEAGEQADNYRDRLGELKSVWGEYRNTAVNLSRVNKDLTESVEKVENEEAELADLTGRLRVVLNKIEIFLKLLEEMGIADIDRRMRELEDRQQFLKQEMEQKRTHIADIKVKLGINQSKSEDAALLLKQADTILEDQSARWLLEWDRRLVVVWNEIVFSPSDKPVFIRTAGQVVQRYRDKYANKTSADLSNQLFDAFYSTRQALHDYAPETLEEKGTGRQLVLFTRDRQNPLPPHLLAQELRELEEEQKNLLSQKDRELYEQIILHSVGKAIRDKIYRAEKWVGQMNKLMQQRETSSGLRLQLRWEPRAAASEKELDTTQLVRLLKTDPRQLRDEHIEQMIEHFRSRISRAKQEADQRDTLRQWIYRLLDYRHWFRFTLYYEKGGQARREMTDARFNVLSGGEKALSMYIPLFAAVYSRYSDSREEAPKIICLDEAFAGVDEENMRDMFDLLTRLGFDYMMTSQVLWGCYDTVPELSIYEIYRPRDVDFVTLIRYHWNGIRRELVDTLQEEPEGEFETFQGDEELESLVEDEDLGIEDLLDKDLLM